MTDDFFGEHLSATPIVAIFRGHSPERTVELCEAAWEAGIRLVEVPIQDASALLSLEAAVAAGAAQGRPVGAGTVTTTARLRAAADAGAAFTVAPGTASDVLALSTELALPHLPGVATSSDITLAERHGYVWLKAFPAVTLDPAWPRQQRGPFPWARFVATGGVRVDEIDAYLERGYDAVGLGSELASREAIDAIRSRKDVSA